MTTTGHLIRFSRVFVLVFATAILVSAGTALAGVKPKPGKAPADAFERYAATHRLGGCILDSSRPSDVFERDVFAHPFGQGVLDAGQSSDVFGRYVLAHPFGQGERFASCTTQSGVAGVHHIPLVAVADKPRASRKAVRQHRATRNATTGLAVDDWFRDASSRVPARHAVSNAATGLAVDDWFRDASSQAPSRRVAKKAATGLTIDDWFRNRR